MITDITFVTAVIDGSKFLLLCLLYYILLFLFLRAYHENYTY